MTAPGYIELRETLSGEQTHSQSPTHPIMAEDATTAATGANPDLDPSTTASSQLDDQSPQKKKKTKRGWRFWAVFACLAITAFLSALEGAIVSTALPTIARSIQASENYLWVVNAYFLTRYV